MKQNKTIRGFNITKFTDTYGAECSLQKSSSIEDKIWLGVNDANPQIMKSQAAKHGLPLVEGNGWMDFPLHEDVLLTTRMHLDRDQVKELLPYLNKFVETGDIS